LSDLIAAELKDNEDSPLCRELHNYTNLQTIEETSVSILDFVNRYKKLTSLPAPQFKPFELHRLLESTFFLMKDLLINKEIELKHKIDKNNSFILADQELIRQGIINLLKNSIEALEFKKGNLIEVKTIYDKQNVIITISDNGSGIPEEIIDQIFIPFFTTKAQGSGIGLTLVQQIVNLHNGEIRVKSIPGSGTTFAIYLPLLK